MFIDFISQPWHWAVSGLVIAVITLGLALAGQRFGVSSAYENFCSIGGLSKQFSFSWQKDGWRMVFIGGSILGGALAAVALQGPAPAISEATTAHLQELGVSYDGAKEAGRAFIPVEIFRWDSLKGIAVALLGGVLIGFGARWAGGCTSGHAITGMAQLQLPSLVTVIGFFIGGLLMTHLLFPIIAQL